LAAHENRERQKEPKLHHFPMTTDRTKAPEQRVSSDLTFITNENGHSLADRFGVLLGNNTRFFDCLVGYFYLSGFKRLADSLNSTERIRILVGLGTDRPIYNQLLQANEQAKLDLLSHSQVNRSDTFST
jgi:hypothetical protein